MYVLRIEIELEGCVDDVQARQKAWHIIHEMPIIREDELPAKFKVQKREPSSPPRAVKL